MLVAGFFLADNPACFSPSTMLYLHNYAKGLRMAQAVSILIIDDEDTLRNLLKAELEQHNYAVDAAESGEAGIEKLHEKRFNLIILDIRMPGMDGLEVLKKIREQDLADKVIMLTGVDELKIARDSLQLGANDFLTKPYDIKTLLACIKRVMAER